MSQHSQKKFLIGAAVAAGILSTLASLLNSKDRRDWTDQASDLADQYLDRKEGINKNLLIGTVAGGVVGVTAALLLAPKAGSELIHDLYQPFQKSRKELKSKAKSLKKDISQKISKIKAELKGKKTKKTKTRRTSLKSKAKKGAKTVANAVSAATES